MILSLLPAALLLASAVAAPTPPPARVYAGVYLADVSAFDLKEGRFKADLRLWAKWKGGEEPPKLTVVNGEIDEREEESREADGDWRSIRWRVQGTFRGTFPLQDFPFDRQTLPVILSLGAGQAELVPDLASSGMAPQFSITGWLYEPYFSARTSSEAVASDLGAVHGEGETQRLSSVTFSVELHRPFAAYLLKFLLPLAVILLMGVLSFFFPPDQIEVRASIVVTALLSVVAFHFTQSGSLPDVSYLVVADKMFLAAYAVVLALLISTVLSYRLHAAHPRSALRVDRTVLCAVPAACLALGLALTSPPTRAEVLEPPRVVAEPAEGGGELRFGVAVLPSLATAGIPSLTARGLTYVDGQGERRPHLVQEIPSTTNSTVRFLPDGGMSVRWTLRPGLRWSDGAPIASDDLVYSLGLYEAPSRASVERLDDRTVVVRYRDRRPSALQDFTVYPRHAAEPLTREGGRAALTERTRKQPMPGDGPFRFVSYDGSSTALFERNPFFAGAPPHIERVRVVSTGAGGAPDAIRTGKVDLARFLSVESAKLVKAVPGTVVTGELSHFVLLLQPDLSVPALGDVRVRRALLAAIDRERLARFYFGDQAEIPTSYRPRSAPDHVPVLHAPSFNPDAARKALVDAGVKLPLRLSLAHVEAPAQSTNATLVEIVRDGLERAGVTVTPRPLNGKAVGDAFLDGRHGGLLLAYRDSAVSPARFFNLPYDRGSQRYDLTVRPHFEASEASALGRLERTFFVERREVLSRQLQEAWGRTLPVLPIAFGVDHAVHRERLKGYAPGDASSPFWNIETWELALEAPDPPPVAGSTGP